MGAWDEASYHLEFTILKLTNSWLLHDNMFAKHLEKNMPRHTLKLAMESVDVLFAFHYHFFYNESISPYGSTEQ